LSSIPEALGLIHTSKIITKLGGEGAEMQTQKDTTMLSLSKTGKMSLVVPQGEGKVTRKK
jgi:hypothetical protein